MAEVQKGLERNLLQLHRNLKQLEKREHEIDAQEKRVAERNAKRLLAENDPTQAAQGSVKRLKSTVVVKSIEPALEPVEDSPKPVPRPVAPTSDSERGRNRRLLGNLLLGTLSQFQKQVVEKPDENVRLCSC
jgi:hypothetical protein